MRGLHDGYVFGDKTSIISDIFHTTV